MKINYNAGPLHEASVALFTADDLAHFVEVI